MKHDIHPTAIVEPGAQLGEGCVIHAGAIIKACAILGERVVVHPYAVVGGDPQVLKFDPATRTGLKVGARTIVREYVTLNRSTKKDGFTTIGSDCLLMACSHVGHDSTLGNNIVVANSVLIAGHVDVSDYAILGGGAGFHQFTRIGEGSITGGLARITKDIPPYTMVAERDQVAGLNLVGLKRRGASRDAIRELKEAFRLVYSKAGNIREIAAAGLASGGFKLKEARRFLEFIQASGTRGVARARGRRGAEDEDGD